MSQINFWCVYDVLNDKSIGIWDDISYAEEFLMENQDDFDVWAVMPSDELILTEA
jgi:hypothetical protein